MHNVLKEKKNSKKTAIFYPQKKSLEKTGKSVIGAGGILSRRQLRGKVWDFRCDSLLPESIPDCKSVEIAQNFPPQAGSFSETPKKAIKILGSLLHNVTSTATLFHNATLTEAPAATPFHNATSTKPPPAALFHNVTSTEAPKAVLFHNVTPAEPPPAVLFHNMTSKFLD